MDAQRTRKPHEAAEVLRKALKDPKKPFTVADAEVASGLPQRDVEAGLNALTAEYRGHLRVTEDGDLVHFFPNGFTKPWDTKDSFDKIMATIGRSLLGVGRFVIRAWILAAMVGYAALFVALLIALSTTRNNNSSRGGGIGALAGGMLRLLADALFWTFHPFSPVYVDPSAFGAQSGSLRRDADETPFYEKVNRFVFGPTAPPEDPNVATAKVLAEIRAKKGRIGIADVLRVTGLARERVDAMMAQLMLDHDGDVDVGENGGIIYRFKSLRRTAGEIRIETPEPAWSRRKVLPPLTGNGGGANVGIALLNGFNLLAAAFATASGFTISNLMLLFSKHPPPFLPDDGLPIVLGVIPLFFSLGIFVMPIARAALRSLSARKVKRENGRLAMLREILSRATKKEEVTDQALRGAYRVATGDEPSSSEITKHVVELGGDVVPDIGDVKYRFAGLEDDQAALEEERAEAEEAEARLGKVVFGSDR
ncbi:hypothetical protein BH09MYX1_BH09MYX1_06180 [soil metagenome]